MVALLWAFALFDVLGRDVGVIHAMWIIVVTCVFSYLLHFVMYMLKSRKLLLSVCDVTSNNKRKDMESEENAVEFVVVVENPAVLLFRFHRFHQHSCVCVLTD
jgi:hypothetical protein